MNRCWFSYCRSLQINWASPGQPNGIILGYELLRKAWQKCASLKTPRSSKSNRMCISLECKKDENICGEVCYHPESEVHSYSQVMYVMKNNIFRNRCVNQTSPVIRGKEVEGSASFNTLKSRLWKVSWNSLKSKMDVWAHTGIAVCESADDRWFCYFKSLFVDLISPLRRNELVSIYECVH